MNTSTHYTPTLDEFHIGFEFEYRTLERGKVVWEKTVCDNYNFDSESWVVINKENLEYRRVKFLDREDIESLGWKFNYQYPGLNELNFDLKDLELDYDFNSHYLRICFEGNGDVTRFSGTIKNKSELKRLMVQLGIANELT